MFLIEREYEIHANTKNQQFPLTQTPRPTTLITNGFAIGKPIHAIIDTIIITKIKIEMGSTNYLKTIFLPMAHPLHTHTHNTNKWVAETPLFHPYIIALDITRLGCILLYLVGWWSHIVLTTYTQ